MKRRETSEKKCWLRVVMKGFVISVKSSWKCAHWWRRQNSKWMNECILCVYVRICLYEFCVCGVNLKWNFISEKSLWKELMMHLQHTIVPLVALNGIYSIQNTRVALASILIICYVQGAYILTHMYCVSILNRMKETNFSNQCARARARLFFSCSRLTISIIFCVFFLFFAIQFSCRDERICWMKHMTDSLKVHNENVSWTKVNTLFTFFEWDITSANESVLCICAWAQKVHKLMTMSLKIAFASKQSHRHFFFVFYCLVKSFSHHMSGGFVFCWSRWVYSVLSMSKNHLKALPPEKKSLKLLFQVNQ